MSVSVPRFTSIIAALVAVTLLVASGGMAAAATGATKDEAVIMVQKAVAYIKAEGPDKAYAEISNPSGQFVDRDLYIVIYRLDGMVPAHGVDATRIGKNLIGDKDADGKAFVKERIELAKTHDSFWQSYKFMNPVTHEVAPKRRARAVAQAIKRAHMVKS